MCWVARSLGLWDVGVLGTSGHPGLWVLGTSGSSASRGCWDPWAPGHVGPRDPWVLPALLSVTFPPSQLWCVQGEGRMVEGGGDTVPRMQHPTGSHICLRGGTARLRGTPCGRGKTTPHPRPRALPPVAFHTIFAFIIFIPAQKNHPAKAAVGGDAPSPSLAWRGGRLGPLLGHARGCPWSSLSLCSSRGDAPPPVPLLLLHLLGLRESWGSPGKVGASRALWCPWAEVGCGDLGLRPSGGGSWGEREDGVQLWGGRWDLMLLFPLLPHGPVHPSS